MNIFNKKSKAVNLTTVYIAKLPKHYKVVIGNEGKQLRMLNERSLTWNLKHVFGFDQMRIAEALGWLKETGEVEFDVEVAS